MSKLDCASTNGVLPRKKAGLAAIGVLLGFDGRSYAHRAMGDPALEPFPSMCAVEPNTAYLANRRTLKEIGSPITTMCTTNPRIRSCSF